ncbi:unnamed protein product [Caenorhabditis bovis]|uniref:Acyl_transf_3 domain-containing protein n=1 Tax=Caenorhabditis bovis TaxID=2654633 RepID=A0A8S1ELI1_9PELO|nr:unnamed protein product [Caenorhabditis bovis]
MRFDIQSYRAIAILAVVGFHLFPEALPNGYLGVDVFFVISGFLMSRILYSKAIDHKTINVTMVFCVIYYLLLFLINFGKHLFRAEVWWPANQLYAFFSALFLTNVKVLADQRDYFKAANIKSSNIFLHCWSLSVEVQFYLIVPFIFIGIHFIKRLKARIVALLILAVVSYSLTFYSSSVAFNFTPSRVWQFAFGILADVVKRAESTELKKSEKCGDREFIAIQLQSALLASLFLIFWPSTIASQLIRPLITAVAALLIYADLQFPILNSSALCYIGDISYIIYLVHWPIILRRSAFATEFLDLCFFLSIGIHHLIEKPLLRQQPSIVVAMLLACIAANCALLYTEFKHADVLKFATPYSPKVDENLALDNFFWQNATTFKLLPTPDDVDIHTTYFGHKRFVSGNGTLKYLLLGNSYMSNQAEAIRMSLNGNYSTFESVGVLGNYVLYEDHPPKTALLEKITNRVAIDYKPDVILIILKHAADTVKTAMDNPDSDRILHEMRENLKILQSCSKRIYIMRPLPQAPLKFLNMFVADLMNDADELDRFHIPYTKHKTTFKQLTKRLENLNCPKCQLYDLASVQLHGNVYHTFDPATNLVYYENTIHFTQPFLDLIQPFYSNLTSNIQL